MTRKERTLKWTGILIGVALLSYSIIGMTLQCIEYFTK